VRERVAPALDSWLARAGGAAAGGTH
jgi:hypothetical protein